jgi:hypothetical protein
MERTVQNKVPPGDYGLYFALFNFAMTLQVANNLGIKYFNNSNIFGHEIMPAFYNKATPCSGKSWFTDK